GRGPGSSHEFVEGWLRTRSPDWLRQNADIVARLRDQARRWREIMQRRMPPPRVRNRWGIPRMPNVDPGWSGPAMAALPLLPILGEIGGNLWREIFGTEPPLPSWDDFNRDFDR